MVSHNTLDNNLSLTLLPLSPLFLSSLTHTMPYLYMDAHMIRSSRMAPIGMGVGTGGVWIVSPAIAFSVKRSRPSILFYGGIRVGYPVDATRWQVLDSLVSHHH